MTATAHAKPTPERPGTEKHAGWDGRSQSITEVVSDCGCRWTRDGQALLGVSTACLTGAVRAANEHDYLTDALNAVAAR